MRVGLLSFGLLLPLMMVPGMNAAAVTCTPGVTSVPVFATSSASGEVGDYTLNCTGGVPIPTGDVVAVLNVPVLNTGGWVLTDGIDNFGGVLVNPTTVEFEGVASQQTSFQVENIFVNPSAEPAGFQFEESVSVFGPTPVFIPSGQQQQEVAANATTPEPSILWPLGLGMSALWLARKGRR